MNKFSILISWLFTHFLICIAHSRFLELAEGTFIQLLSMIVAYIMHDYVYEHFIKVYTDIGNREKNC